MSIEEILEEMESLLLEAARVPFTNKRLLEEDDLGRLIDELRDSLPGELMEANKIISDRQQLLEQAQKDAQSIVEQAKTYINKLTDESNIMRQAQEQAAEIVQRARKTSHELQTDSFGYADDVFGYMEETLTKALDVVKQGHNQLTQSSTKCD